MPGYVMHLALCEEILKKCNVSDEGFVASFRIGNIIPDTKGRGKKKESHYWPDLSMSKLVRKPDLDSFLVEYGDELGKPYVLGYYSHLLLDRKFMDNYWDKHFSFYDEDWNEDEGYDTIKWVKLAENNQSYDRDQFFSSEYYYGDYDRANSYIMHKYQLCFDECYKSLQVFAMDKASEKYNIGNISIEDSMDALSKMIDFLKTDLKNVSNTDVLAYPKLSVLNLSEIENIIEEVAEEISEKIKKLPQYDNIKRIINKTIN